MTAHIEEVSPVPILAEGATPALARRVDVFDGTVWGSVFAALRIGLLVFMAAGVAILARTTSLGPAVEDFARSLGELADRPWAPFAYVAIYAVGVGIGLPGTLFSLIGGVAFGLARGFAINMTGATIGASIGFVLGRTLGREVLERLLHRHLSRLQTLETGRTAFRFFLRLRLTPLVPFSVLNFAAGVTRSRLGPFLGGTALGIVPSTFLVTFFATALVKGGEARAGALLPLTLATLGLFVLSMLPTIVRYIRKRSGLG
jgi:uncharacterized membrane protein YdjX (TVP38/TMEM64 family)